MSLGYEKMEKIYDIRSLTDEQSRMNRYYIVYMEEPLMILYSDDFFDDTKESTMVHYDILNIQSKEILNNVLEQPLGSGFMHFFGSN